MLPPIGCSSATETPPAIPDIPCRVEDMWMNAVSTYEGIMGLWDSFRPWLAWHGITVYEFGHGIPDDGWGKRWRCPRTSTKTTSLPFSTCLSPDDDVPRITHTIWGPACAQDRMGRNVMLKLVNKGSEEHTINQLLLQNTSSMTDATSFPCVLPPIAILDTPHNYSFVVMPMWANPVYVEDLESLGAIVKFMQCLLRGLAYLHECRIVHRDICQHNILVNIHCPGIEGEAFQTLLREHRRSSEVIYAFMDYDQSLRLPPDTSLVNCRRPAREAASGGNLYRSSDLFLGEPFYNPFAYDVGSLGTMFRSFLSEAVTELPGLAALFDCMTDHSVPRRWTAEQALVFLDGIASQLSDDARKAPITLNWGCEAAENADVYWRKLSSAELQVWGKYRTPPRSFLGRILDWVTAFPIGWRVVRSIREVLQL